MGKVKKTKASGSRTGALTALAFCVAVAMLLSYVESLLPSLPVPGIKLGLANVAVMVILYLFGIKEAIIVSISRVLLISIIFGNPVSLIYGLSGAILSLSVMYILKKFTPFSPIGVSVAGGVAHNLGQIIAACFIMGTARVAFYLPVLLLSGIISGIFIGACAGITVRKLRGKL